MKIIICGKGGSGKSTIISLLARQNAALGRRTIVVDTDVSNVGINRILGTGPTRDLKDLLGTEESRPADSGQEAWTCDTLPDEYTSSRDGVQLITIGKISEVSQECKCTVSAVARDFIGGLESGPDDLVFVDTEAGVEHFGRGFDSLCDVILMVVDPTFESIALLDRISGMARTIGVPFYYILNKTDSGTSAVLRNKIPGRHPIIGEFPQDAKLLAAGLRGQLLPSDYPAAAELLNKIAKENISPKLTAAFAK